MKNILLTLFISATTLTFAKDIYVSSNPSTYADGSQQNPVSFGVALEKASTFLKSTPALNESVNIYLKGGNYRFTKTFVLGKEFDGSEKFPITIKAIDGDTVTFDGTKIIPIESFQKVTDKSERSKLASKAVDEIYAATIKDKELIEAFSSKLMINLTLDNNQYLPSVYPNNGYAYFLEKTVTAEITPPAIPVGKENYGVRAGHVPYLQDGKERGWRGSLDEPKGARAKIAKKENEMAGTWQQWEDELKRTNRRNILKGFIEANWFLSEQEIYGASAKDRCIHLSKALAYGWAWKKNDKPFRVFGMLCELDNKGEWYFDTATNRLYIYPTSKITKDSTVALSVAKGFIKLDNANFVNIEGLSVKSLASGIAYDIKGKNNTIAGATISKSTANGITILGLNNKVISCNLFDLNSHITINGKGNYMDYSGKVSGNDISIKDAGGRSPDGVFNSNNLVTNCLIYQKDYKHEKVNVAINGAGNTFSHNMVHNSIGQAVWVRGNNQTIEFNELFNIGYNEGDGGSIYSGADLAGYGNVYRYNFFHHLMHVPGKVPRSGLHLDDGQSGATVYGNVFYKSAANCIHAFGGSGHTMYDNIFLNSYRGIFFRTALGKKMLDIEKHIKEHKNSHHIGTKEDYIGRVERSIGKEAWKKSPWKDLYPLFAEVMSNEGIRGRLWATHYTIKNNFAHKLQIEKVDIGMDKETLKQSSVEQYKKISPEDFVDYDNMNFEIKDKNKYPNIAFNSIGLYKDKYRKSIPNKDKYRNQVKEFFKGIPSMWGTKKQIDTSKIVK